MIHKTTRSILSVLLAALLLVTSIPLTPAFAGEGGAVSLQSESGEGRALTGSGTKENPYQIATANDLREFAQRVNNGQIRADADAVLTDDINLNNQPWYPIGSDSRPYSGTFDGANYTISGLYIDSSDNDYKGLFGYVGTRGTVQNLSVSGSVKGDDYVGGVVGQNRGSVENCYNTGAVNSSGNRAGGVVGYNSSIGNVKNCYNTGAVNSSGNWVGGVVGVNSGSVTNCYNTGAVSGSDWYVGGVVGWNDSGANVENCYNTGKVSGNSYVGGVAGDNSSIGTVTNCYFLQGTAEKGIGSGTGSATPLSAEAFESQKSFTSWDFDNTWEIKSIFGRPTLRDNAEIGGTANNPYKIFTATQLAAFRDIVNGKNGQRQNKFAHAKLMENIDLSEICGESAGNWTPIGTSISDSYEGTFNGDGHTISGLYIGSSTANYQGLFGRVNGGTVQDLTVSGSVKGDDYVGGVVGYNYSGIVTGCIFSGSGSVSGVTGSDYVGGVVGDNGSSASVENCYNTGSVNGSADSSSVGGVVGDNSGTVKNCYNTDAVSGSGWYVGGVVGSNSGTVENCYNTDKVSGNRSVGGAVGWNISSGNVKNCYNTGTVSGSDHVGGVVGQNDSGSVTGCYFLKTADVNEKLLGIGEGSGSATEKDDTAFHSGEVAYLLQNGQKAAGAGEPIPLVWGQSDLNTPDSWPTLVALDKNAKTVYQVTLKYDHAGAQDKTYYTDDTATPSEQPSRDGYTFDHWDKTEGEGNTITYTAKWTPHTYSITASPSTLDFGSITEGEERPAAQTVTVKNTGNQTVTLNPPTAENFEIGALSLTTELEPDATATFTIQPKDKLPRGSYSEQIAISNTNGEKATITATFTVKEPPYTGKYSYEVFTSVGDNGTVTVDRYATEGEKVTISVSPDEAYKLDDLVVTAGGKDVELVDNGDGTYSFTMPSADVRISASFAEDPDWTEPEPEPSTDVSDIFLDVAPNAWYKDAIQYAYDNGLMTGVSDTEFAPEATTTRAMIVSILARLEGVTTAEAAGFADVDDEWYATAVNWAAANGVVNGYEDNTFRPNQPITREQLAAILMNYASYKGEDVSNRASLATYTDQPSTWAQEAMQWAVAEGLISGVTNDQLQPQSSATRAQVAAILQRLLEA